MSTQISRRSFIRIAGGTAAMLTMGGALVACTNNGSDAPKGESQEGKDKTQVVIAMPASSEPEMGFNPVINWGGGEHAHEPLIQSTLINTDVNLNFINDLATSYESSADALTWTFKIRDDIKFTDGEPLHASDVAFTYNTIVNTPESEVDLSMLDHAEATDDTTIVFHMKQPYNAFLYQAAVIGIVPEHAYSAEYGSNPIGSGRYKLEQWDKGQQCIFVANDDYYGEAPKMKRVVVVFMAEDASLAGAQSGQIDVAYTSAVLSGAKVEGYELKNFTSVDSRGISLPVEKPGGTRTDDKGVEYPVGNSITSDEAIRHAINFGLDRDALVQNVLNGYGKVAYSVGDGMPWTSEDMKCEYDLEAARQYLSDAGWELGSDGIVQKDGQRASFDLWYPETDSVRQGLANEFSNQMKNIGIEVVLHGASWDEIFTHKYSDPVVWGWGTNSPMEIYSLNYSTSEGNFAGYTSPKIDQYIDQALSQERIEDSYEYWKKAQWDGAEGITPKSAAPWVWMANIDHLYYANTSLHIAEQKPHPHGHGWSLTNNVDQWTWS